MDSTSSSFTMNEIFAFNYNAQDHIENEHILLVVCSATKIISSEKNSVYSIICCHVATK